jgi:hypothetical protein
MSSNFAGEILFYRYDDNRSKDRDLPPGPIISKSERIGQTYRRVAGVYFMTTLLVALASRSRDATS